MDTICLDPQGYVYAVTRTRRKSPTPPLPLFLIYMGEGGNALQTLWYKVLKHLDVNCNKMQILTSQYNYIILNL